MERARPVVIVGAGLAGLNAAKALAPSRAVAATFIDRREHHRVLVLIHGAQS